MPDSSSAVVLFDGVCNLCNGFVQFIIRHDAAGRFRFAALQSEAGQAVLAAQGIANRAADDLLGPESVVLVLDGAVYTHSTAVLRIAGELGGVWRLAAAGWLLPRPWRDALYRWVGRNRYRWFGRRESCMLPTAELRGRFL